MYTYWPETHPLLFSTLVLAVSALLALAVHQCIYLLRGRKAEHQQAPVWSLLAKHLKGPTRVILPLLAIVFVLQFVPVPENWRGVMQHIAELAVIAAIGWGLTGLARLITGLGVIPTVFTGAAMRVRSKTSPCGACTPKCRLSSASSLCSSA